jgi:hypothetical protein
LAAENDGIMHDRGGLTTQQMDYHVREHVCEIDQSMTIIDKQSVDLAQCPPQINHCVTQISDLAG